MDDKSKGYVCCLCSKHFKTKHSLKEHLLQKHKEELEEKVYDAGDFLELVAQENFTKLEAILIEQFEDLYERFLKERIAEKIDKLVDEFSCDC